MNIIRIAMWSGPRNISTAMMRAWENRDDTAVIDEPLYGPYLYKTQKQHPMCAEIIKDQGKDVNKIIKQLTTDKLPENKNIYYQKHMCHHILDEYDISWVKQLNNVFLIRDPLSVLPSYLKKHKDITPQDLGYPQQLKLFNYVKENCGYTPIVMSSKDILKNPQAMMKLLCEKLDVKFDRNMLLWPKGYRSTDGVWAKHWYNQVIESTGFSKKKPKIVSLTMKEETIAKECQTYYNEILKHAIKINS